MTPQPLIGIDCHRLQDLLAQVASLQKTSVLAPNTAALISRLLFAASQAQDLRRDLRSLQFRLDCFSSHKIPAPYKSLRQIERLSTVLARYHTQLAHLRLLDGPHPVKNRLHDPRYL